MNDTCNLAGWSSDRVDWNSDEVAEIVMEVVGWNNLVTRISYTHL